MFKTAQKSGLEKVYSFSATANWQHLCLFSVLTLDSHELLKAIKEGLIIAWQHIKFHGEYDFSEEKLKDSVGFDLPEILNWKLEEKRE